MKERRKLEIGMRVRFVTGEFPTGIRGNIRWISDDGNTFEVHAIGCKIHRRQVTHILMKKKRIAREFLIAEEKYRDKSFTKYHEITPKTDIDGFLEGVWIHVREVL